MAHAEAHHVRDKGRAYVMKGATELAEHNKIGTAGGQGLKSADRQHSPEQDRKAKEESEAPDAVWLHGTLKIHVRC